MRPNPLHDVINFLTKPGALTVVFWLLLVGSVAAALLAWMRYPAQRTLRHAAIWLTRLLIGDVQAHHRPDMGVVLVSGAILLRFVDGRLQIANGRAHLVGRVGILFEQIAHDTHALVERLLHLRHLLLQRLNLRLQFDQVFIDGECRNGCRGQD